MFAPYLWTSNTAEHKTPFLNDFNPDAAEKWSASGLAKSEPQRSEAQNTKPTD